jgi:hypothetical protein
MWTSRRLFESIPPPMVAVTEHNIHSFESFGVVGKATPEMPLIDILHIHGLQV